LEKVAIRVPSVNWTYYN